ncbi:hypothetical protein Godav_016993 [Gossypium davidsonii]|uniref:Dynein light chain n=2 Tax=Gossypium TaxID=3633 RepID=A0A0D2N5L4_GOSRA|nr:uncharacterized protein LOC105785225 isoform X1 [Gossypium raimondii]KJB07863.1 hypothetical protein B456_001G048800 [Gossypium raimondii]MBA0578269.1 hypothetical protein [Gossypium raimondii]MBA0604324.1 hypothetical protein [Gossypium davidsonii]
MERQRSYNGRRNIDERPKNLSQCRLQRSSSLPPVARAPPPPPPPNQLKLAAMAIDLNVRLRSADMPLAMQERAIRKARALVDANNPGITKPTQVAMCLKKEFDALYGPAWHCIVGKSFGSFVTHAGGGFLYFSVDKLCFLLFKTEVRPLVKPPSLHRLKINNA